MSISIGNSRAQISIGSRKIKIPIQKNTRSNCGQQVKKCLLKLKSMGVLMEQFVLDLNDHIGKYWIAFQLFADLLVVV